MKILNNERNKLKELTKISLLHDSIVRTKKSSVKKLKIFSFEWNKSLYTRNYSKSTSSDTSRRKSDTKFDIRCSLCPG